METNGGRLFQNTISTDSLLVHMLFLSAPLHSISPQPRMIRLSHLAILFRFSDRRENRHNEEMSTLRHLPSHHTPSFCRNLSSDQVGYARPNRDFARNFFATRTFAKIVFDDRSAASASAFLPRKCAVVVEFCAYYRLSNPHDLSRGNMESGILSFPFHLSAVAPLISVMRF